MSHELTANGKLRVGVAFAPAPTPLFIVKDADGTPRPVSVVDAGRVKDATADATANVVSGAAAVAQGVKEGVKEGTQEAKEKVAEMKANDASSSSTTVTERSTTTTTQR